jgi:iron complex outermembrane receptor protein
VREPSRIDREFFVPAQPPYLLAGGPDFTSEISNTFELGYRAQPSPILSYSVTAFHARHSKLRSLENKSGVFIFENRMFGTTSGIEAWGSYQVMRSWRLSAGVTWLRQLLHLEPGSTGAGVAIEGNDPSHTWVLRSSHDLSERSDFDFAIRHVGALPNPAVPAYTAVDMRYAHRLRPGLEASVTLLNLFDPRHPEFGTAATRSEIGRSLYLKLVWRL